MTKPVDDRGAIASENVALRAQLAELKLELERYKRAQTELVEAEERFRNFFDNAPIGKSMTAPDGKLLRVNAAFCRILGYTAEELQRLNFVAVSHPADLAETNEQVRTLLAGEKDIATFEKRYITKAGSIVTAQVTTRVQRDKHGTPQYLLTHILDITESKRAEQEIAEQRTLLKNLVESAGSPIFSVDYQYGYTSFNTQHAAVMKSLYGVDIQIGQSLLDYQHATDDQLQTKANIDRALGGEQFTDKGYSGNEALTRLYFEVSHYPIRDDANRIVGVAVFARDVTAQRRAEEELRRINLELDQRVNQRTAQLEEVNHELEAFSYSVSHDLRAPLRAIDGFTRILASDYATELAAEGQRLCSVICKNTEKMGLLIDELLAFSRQGRVSMNPTRIDMQAMALSVFEEITMPQSRERISFRVGTLPEVLADHTLMHQVWVNLLSNAVKFSSKRERAVINVQSTLSGCNTTYVVTDNGAGFDMQYQDKLYGVFQRLHSNSEYEGNGIGLALIQRIISRHGGRVWAEGAVNQGASFYFSLPTPQELL